MKKEQLSQKRNNGMNFAPLMMFLCMMIFNNLVAHHVPVAFAKTRPVWTQLGGDIDGEAAGDESGWDVSLSDDGNVVAIGAYKNDGNGTNSGHVRVYKWDETSNGWTQRGDDIDGEAAFDESSSVSLSGDGNVVAIGARRSNAWSGHVRVYVWDVISNGWTQRGDDIDGEEAGDLSGSSVSLSRDGNVVAIGAPGNDGNGTNSGHVRVYEWDVISNGWTQRGGDIDGEETDDLSGSSVSLSRDGNVVAIGASYNAGNYYYSGHVRVFEWDVISNGWTQRGDDIDGDAYYEELGYSVSLSGDGNVVAIGAPHDILFYYYSGHVRVYEWDEVSRGWTQRGDDIDGEAANDASGSSVSLSDDGNVVAIGAFQNDGNGTNSGHVRVYEWDVVSRGWIQLGDDIDGEAAYDWSGSSVSLSRDGNVVAIGAPFNNNPNPNGNYYDGPGHVRVYTVNPTRFIGKSHKSPKGKKGHKSPKGKKGHKSPKGEKLPKADLR